MRNNLERQGAWKNWTILEVRAWMAIQVRLDDSPETLTERAARAFNVWEMQRHLKPGDHWAFDLAAHAIAQHQKEVTTARAYFATEELLEQYIRTGSVPAAMLEVTPIQATPAADCSTCQTWGPACCKLRAA